MKSRMIQFVPAVVAILVVGFRYFSLWCTEVGHACYRTWLDIAFLGIINPFDSFARYFLPIAVILAFVPRGIFKSWLKFAVWALPIAFIYIATTPVSWSGMGLNFSSFYRDDAARLMGGVFTVVSALLIIYKLIATRFLGKSDSPKAVKV